MNKENSVLNIVNYGAVDLTNRDVNDYIDSTVAIQAAIDEALLTGKPVYIPIGKFLVSNLHITGKAGITIIGERQPDDELQTGSVLLCNGQSCLLFDRIDGSFQYQVVLKNFGIIHISNATASIHFKNIQESYISDVGIWCQNNTVNVGVDLDGAGIFNIDKLLVSRAKKGIKMHHGTLPNPQAIGGCNISNCNIYYADDSIEIGYTLGLNIHHNWIEGFQNGILITNDNDSSKIEVSTLNITDNSFTQSTGELIQTRGVIAKTNSLDTPVTLDMVIKNNLFYMSSSNSIKPDTAIELDIPDMLSPVSGDISISDNRLFGTTVAGVITNTSRIKTRVSSNNICLDDLFGNPCDLVRRNNNGVVITDAIALETSRPLVTSENNGDEHTLKQLMLPEYITGKNGAIIISTIWSMNNNANIKWLRIRLGDMYGWMSLEFNAAGNNFVIVKTEISCVNSFQNVLLTSYVTGDITGNKITRLGGIVDLRNNTPLLFNTHLGDPSNDYVTLEDLNVTILPR